MTLHLSDPQTDAAVDIEPERGGLVTRFDLAGRRILYLDEATLRDPTKNVRGGIPVLFPSPGKLVGDTWQAAGRHGAMKQHGFARNLPWQVVRSSERAATLELRSDDATRAQYPWDFTVEQTIGLRDRALSLQQTITNRSDTAMPFGFGFHPYFHVRDADKAATRVDTDATRAFDNVTKQDVDLNRDLTRPEVDLHLLDHGRPESALITPGGTIGLRASNDYHHWVIWTVAGKDFVCLEPWTSPGNALNTGTHLITLAPGEVRTLWIEITA